MIGGNDQYFSGIVSIHSGTVKAYGGKWAAAIGAGKSATAGWWGETSVYGGTVRAEGGWDGAGIGGSFESHGGTIRIYGGTIDAYGGKNGAGIGSGRENGQFDIKVYGGKVSATGGQGGAGIGGGAEANATGTFILYDGEVSAYTTDLVERYNLAGAGLGAGTAEFYSGGDFAGSLRSAAAV